MLAAGRLHPVKDHATLLRAFALVAGGRNARLVVIGEGGERDRLLAFGARVGNRGQGPKKEAAATTPEGPLLPVGAALAGGPAAAPAAVRDSTRATFGPMSFPNRFDREIAPYLH